MPINCGTSLHQACYVCAALDCARWPAHAQLPSELVRWLSCLTTGQHVLLGCSHCAPQPTHLQATAHPLPSSSNMSGFDLPQPCFWWHWRGTNCTTRRNTQQATPGIFSKGVCQPFSCSGRCAAALHAMCFDENSRHVCVLQCLLAVYWCRVFCRRDIGADSGLQCMRQHH